jgi:hypothetical protein
MERFYGDPERFGAVASKSGGANQQRKVRRKMKEHPIPLYGWEVNAILENRMSQLRRVVRPQPDYSILKPGTVLEPHICPELVPSHHGKKAWGFYCKPYHGRDVPAFAFDCPYGTVGDTLWVRETWQQVVERKRDHQWFVKPNPQQGVGEILYAATHAGEAPPKWRPSIHMPRWASRLTLKNTDIRVQRLQDISEEDAIAEGITHAEFAMGVLQYRVGGKDYSIPYSFKGGFCNLWNKINAKKHPWSSNPWVRVISFERTETELCEVQ